MIRHLNVDEVAAARLAALEALAFPDRQVKSVADDMLSFSRQHGAAVFADADAQAGYLLLRCVADEAEILDIGVVPAARQNGVARALLKTAERHAVSLGVVAVFLEVAEDNLAARALYSGAGFVEVGRRHGYYSRPGAERVDALVLRKSLDELADSGPGAMRSPPPRGEG